MASAYTLSRAGHVRADAPTQIIILSGQIGTPAGLLTLTSRMRILIALQGFAEVLRCIVCLRTGQWPARLHDVEELEQQILREHANKAAAPNPEVGK